MTSSSDNRRSGREIESAHLSKGVKLKSLRGPLILYAAATLLHFAHNAEYLAQYPNLPAWWSRADVYIAWCCLTALGAVGYVLYRRGYRVAGLALLSWYAGLGFAGLLHYTRAPLAHHSAMMNATIWTEAVAAALLLVNLAGAAAQSTTRHAA